MAVKVIYGLIILGIHQPLDDGRHQIQIFISQENSHLGLAMIHFYFQWN